MCYFSSDPPSPIVIDLTDDADDLNESPTPPVSTKPISDKIKKKSVVKIKKMSHAAVNDSQNDVIAPSQSNNSNERRYNLRTRGQIDRSTRKYGKPATESSSDVKLLNYSSSIDCIPLELQSNWSMCVVAREYDKRTNFFPEPGPSKCNFYEHVDIPAYHWKPPVSSQPCDSPSEGGGGHGDTESDDATSTTMLHAQSFYEQSGVFDSPKASPQHSQAAATESAAASDASLYELPLQVIIQMEKNFSSHSAVAPPPETLVVITTEKLPPTCAQVVDDMHTYNIPECIHPTPSYSDSADVTRRKECGTTILQIPGNRLSDLDEFCGDVIAADAGLYGWRKKQYETITGEPASTTHASANNHVREVLAGERKIAISLYRKAPTVDEARKWLKTKCMDKRQPNGTTALNGHTTNARDSPIKVRPDTVKFRLNTGDEMASSDDDCSIVMSPITPVAACPQKRSKEDGVSSLLKSMLLDRSTTAMTPNNQQSSNAKQCLKLNFENVKKSNRNRSECDSPMLFDDSTTVNSDVAVNGDRCDGDNNITLICIDDDDDDDDLICKDDGTGNGQSPVESSAFATRVNKNKHLQMNGITNGVYDVPRKSVSSIL